MYEIMLHLNDDFLKDNAGNSERDTDDLSFLNTEDSDWHMLMHQETSELSDDFNWDYDKAEDFLVMLA